MIIEKLYRKISTWVTLLLLACTFALVVLCSVFVYYNKDLPDYKQLAEYDPPLITRLYTQDGNLMEEYAIEKRIYTKYEEIPELVIKAFLAAEDKNFFSHSGFDFLGIIRAAAQNLITVGRPTGASTITQQVVKNFLLNNEQTYSRKIKEAILAYRVTRAYSKEKVLELYLNQMFLGNSSYGIASAALNYFNKELDELTVAEAAMLAALPKAPSSIDPVKNYSRALARRNWVLGRMLEDNFITKLEYNQAVNEPIELKKRRDMEFVQADFYAEAVRQEMMERFDNDTFYTRGLVIKTNLDSKLQKLATESLRDGLRAYDKKHGWRGPIAQIDYDGKQAWQPLIANYPLPPNLLEWDLAITLKVTAEQAQIGLRNGKTAIIPLKELQWARKNMPEQTLGAAVKSARDVLKSGDVIAVSAIEKDKLYRLEQLPEIEGSLVAMEVGTGKVLAMVGGYSFAQSKYNRAMQAQRQPGSTFKPFVFLAAFEAGYSPTNIVLDSPISLSQGPGLPLWTPKNYGDNFLGPITLRSAMEKSRNVATVRLISTLGSKRVANLAERLGIYKKPPTNFSMALGAFETNLMQITNAYNIIANGGKAVRPQLVSMISDRRGRVLFNANEVTCSGCDTTDANEFKEDRLPVLQHEQEQLVESDINYQFLSVLEGAVKRGTGRRALAIGKTVAGKTGTTNDSFDTWFIGFSPDIVVGVYVGFDNPKTLGKRETGATVALPIFVDFMKKALDGVDDQQFAIPDGIELVAIDGDTGQLATPQTSPSKIIMEAFRKGDNIAKSTTEMATSRQDDERLIKTPFDKLGDQEQETLNMINNSLSGVY